MSYAGKSEGGGNGGGDKKMHFKRALVAVSIWWKQAATRHLAPSLVSLTVIHPDW